MRRATLCYLFDGDDVLLIRKKRGHGEGRYVGPGGKIEAGETPVQAARREVHEETSLQVHAPKKRGELEFYFDDEPFMRVHVFRTESFAGTPTESPEAEPIWFETTALPYDQMWDGDRHWLPLLIDDRSFEGTFVYDASGDILQDHTLSETTFE